MNGDLGCRLEISARRSPVNGHTLQYRAQRLFQIP